MAFGFGSLGDPNKETRKTIDAVFAGIEKRAAEKRKVALEVQKEKLKARQGFSKENRDMQTFKEKELFKSGIKQREQERQVTALAKTQGLEPIEGAGVKGVTDIKKGFTPIKRTASGQTQPLGAGEALVQNRGFEPSLSSTGGRGFKPPSSVESQFSTLSPEQRTEGNKLAKEIFGSAALRSKAGFENIVKPIYARIEAGESIDQISDDLRFKGQSPEMIGAIRDAAQMVTSNLSDSKTQNILDKIDDTLKNGATNRTRDMLKVLALKNSTAVEAKAIKGKERTVEFLTEIYDDLKEFEENGGNTNIFTGTLEEIAKKAGTVRSSEMRKIATKILVSRQKYRRSMTGQAFSPGENLEYDSLFPSISKTSNFNTATIDGLLETFEGDVDFFYGFQLGEEAYNIIYKGGTSQSQMEASPAGGQPQQFNSIAEVEAARFPIGTIVIINGQQVEID